MAASSLQIIIPRHIRVGENVDMLIESDTNNTASITVTLKLSDGSTHVLEPEENKQEVGKLAIKIPTHQEGKHTLSVFVDDKHIEESPCNINIHPPWKLVKTLGDRGSGPGELSDPWGVTVNKDGQYMVTDSNNNRIEIFSPDSAHAWEIKFPDLERNFYPRQVAITSDNRYLIADGSRWINAGNNHVIICDADGNFLGQFGQNQLINPVGIAIDDTQGIVFVVDHGGYCVRLYNVHSGDYIKSFGSRGNGPGQFDVPRYVTINNKRQVLVTDCNNHRVQAFSTTGEFLFMFGCLGDGDNQINLPEGIATDEEDNIYVSDCDNNRVMKYNDRGKFICRIGSETDDLIQPAGITVTNESPPKVIVVDYGNDCVRVFA